MVGKTSCATCICAALMWAEPRISQAAPIGTAFGYSGYLERPAGSPVDGTCNFRFGLWDADSMGAQLGNSPQTKSAVQVIGGVFNILDLDFGPSALNGTARWLEIEVECPGDNGFTLLSPRVELTPVPHASALPGLYTQDNATSPNIVGGHFLNVVSIGVVGATIAGGGHTSAGTYTHAAEASFATVSGGAKNRAAGELSVIGGGFSNTATGVRSSIAGGDNNTASADHATVGGGNNNSAANNAAIVAGGEQNSAQGSHSTIGGGLQNVVNGTGSAVGGGSMNSATGLHTTIAGGRGNTCPGDFSAVGGGDDNSAGGLFSTIAGGGANETGGGFRLAQTVGGGSGNRTSSSYATVSGGRDNEATAEDSIVGGGEGNTASGGGSAICGGLTNSATASWSFVGGGDTNTASGGSATIAGGRGNIASSTYSTVPGGFSNVAAGEYSLAAGRQAKVRTPAQVGGGDVDGDQGTFVWADSTNADFTSTGPNQFLIRAAGGMGLNRNNPAHPLHVGTNAGDGNGAHVTAGGTWTNGSSRSWKRNFRAIDKQELLHKLAELPIMQWQYHGEEDDVRHIGPVAEEFSESFGLGHDDRYITTIDADGVALAAIQGLYEKLLEKECEIAEIRLQKAREVEELRNELADLKTLVQQLAGQSAGGTR